MPDSFHSIAVVCNLEGKIVQVLRDDLIPNDRARLGLPFVSVVDRGSRFKARAFLAALCEQGAVCNWELNLPDEDGIVTLLVAGVVVDEKLVIVGGQTRIDVESICEELGAINQEQASALRAAIKATSTETIYRDDELYQELSRLNNDLAAAQRNVAKQKAELERLNELKTRFLGMAAHDLRNPLVTIQLYSQLLSKKLENRVEPDIIECIAQITASGDFMKGLIEDFLGVSEIESGHLRLHLEDTDILALITRNVSLNSRLAAQVDVKLVFSPRGPFPTMVIDPRKIDQVVNNLLGNAIKFSRKNATVDITMTTVDGAIELRVSDQGPGIPADEIDRLFIPFAQTSAKSPRGLPNKGAGLGLYIAKIIVEGHKGTIEVVSEVGKGAMFIVRLPVEQSDPA